MVDQARLPGKKKTRGRPRKLTPEEIIAACDRLPRAVDGTPILFGWIVGHSNVWWTDPDDPSKQHLGGIFAAWCPGCQRVHRHGWDLREGLGVLEHRVAHCPPGSPLYEGGYYIGLDPKGDHAVAIGERPERKTPAAKLIGGEA